MKPRKFTMRERVQIARSIMRTLGIRDIYTDKQIAKHIKEADMEGMSRENKEKLRKLKTTHGLTNTTEYKYWHSLRTSKNGKLPKSWDNFQTFLNDVGKRPSPKHFLHLRESSKNYSKENCYWDERAVGARILEYDGKWRTQAQWARYFGVSSAALNGAVRKHGSLKAWWENR
jgi:arabinogalactan endo-1,4-beta-galactosidase